MDLKLSFDKDLIQDNINISGSKSESNRLLILQQLYPNLEIKNLSNSDDTSVMQKILSASSTTFDVHHAGTAMRFLTAFFAFNTQTSIALTGSERMQERPIKILVDALNELGANINYMGKKGYPPLEISSKNIQDNSKVVIQGNVSSQYISALILVAPKLKNGLEIELKGDITSAPYIKMTLSLLEDIGISTYFADNNIKIHPKNSIQDKSITVESDWSSASYWYSIIALSNIGTEIKLSSFKKESLQGDNCLVKIYTHFGVTTTFEDSYIILKKETTHEKDTLCIDLKNAPDIAQTIVVTCTGLNISCSLFGLHTLKIKETDRLEALKKELTKLGANISVTNDSLKLESCTKLKSNISINTYNDHRMAMAFAPLAIKKNIIIKDSEVVSKSYKHFWNDLKKVGFKIDKI